jgi:hypothetical protein
MSFSKYRKRRQDKYQRRCLRLAQMRAAKVRKREQRIAEGWEPEPKMERYCEFEYAVRRKSTGECHWHDLVSARQAKTALGLILKFCSETDEIYE